MEHELQGPASRDIREYIKRIKRGDPEAEKAFIAEFCGVVNVILRHDAKLASIPCPDILTKGALSHLIDLIKKDKAGEFPSVKTCLQIMKRYAQHKDVINEAINLHLQNIIKETRDDLNHPDHDPAWEERIEETVERLYFPYIFNLISQREASWKPLRLRNDEKIADQGIKGLTKVMIEDIKVCFKVTEVSLKKLKAENMPEDICTLLDSLKDQKHVGEKRFLNALEKILGEENTETYRPLILKHTRKCYHYGHLIRNIVKRDISDERKIVEKIEKLVSDDSDPTSPFGGKNETGRKFKPGDIGMVDLDASLDRERFFALLAGVIRTLPQLDQYILNSKYWKELKPKEIEQELVELKELGILKIKQKVTASFIYKRAARAEETIMERLKHMGIDSLYPFLRDDEIRI